MSEGSRPSDKPATPELDRSDASSPVRNHSDEDSAHAVLSVGQFFAGPLPLPQVLEGYDQALPGLAERIATMAEDEAKHRRVIERERLNIDSKLELRGQLFGFSVAILSFVIAGVLLAMDRPLYGLASVLAATVGLSGLFVWHRSKSSQKQVEPPKPDKNS